MINKDDLSDVAFSLTHNQNINTHLFKVIQVMLFKMGKIKDINDFSVLKDSYKYGKVEGFYINDIDTFYKYITEPTNRGGMFEFIYKRKYFKQLNINKPVYCALFQDEINKIEEHSETHLLRKRYNDYHILKKFKVEKVENVDMNYNPLYDILTYNYKKYIMKLTLKKNILWRRKYG